MWEKLEKKQGSRASETAAVKGETPLPSAAIEGAPAETTAAAAEPTGLPARATLLTCESLRHGRADGRVALIVQPDADPRLR
jgi:hypothetical protein